MADPNNDADMRVTRDLQSNPGGPEELSDFILPDLIDSPVDNYRVAISGALVIDQGTQTTAVYPVAIRGVKTATPTSAKGATPTSAKRATPTSVKGATPTSLKGATDSDIATSALARWAAKYQTSKNTARHSAEHKPTRERKQSNADQNSPRHSAGSSPVSTKRRDSHQGNHDANLGKSSPCPSNASKSEQTGPKTLKTKIYDILENPETGLVAQTFSWVSMGLIVLSVATFIAETMPKFRADLKKPWYTTNTGMFFFGSETFFIAFFTLELVGRFLSCPNKKGFAKNPLNIIDLISILPYYVELMVPKSDDGEGSSSSMTSSLVVLRVLRLFRVLRIFKLGRHSNNMIAFGIALRGSMMELMSLGLFLAIDIVVFASVLYYCEMNDDGSIAQDDPNNFSSIPASCWWAVATITTVGYGDMYPRTWLGKIFGSFCVFSGILVIAFQVPIIVAKFTWTYMQVNNMSNEDTMESVEEEDDSEKQDSITKPDQ